MKKLLFVIASAFLSVASFAQESATKQEPLKFIVTGTSECGYYGSYDFKIDVWQRSNSDNSTVTINWEKKEIEMIENGYAQEGPYYIISVGKETIDENNRATVKLIASEDMNGADDETAEFLIVATDGKSIKEMTQGHIYQIFFDEVYAYELKKAAE